MANSIQPIALTSYARSYFPGKNQYELTNQDLRELPADTRLIVYREAINDIQDVLRSTSSLRITKGWVEPITNEIRFIATDLNSIHVNQLIKRKNINLEKTMEYTSSAVVALENSIWAFDEEDKDLTVLERGELVRHRGSIFVECANLLQKAYLQMPTS